MTAEDAREGVKDRVTLDDMADRDPVGVKDIAKRLGVEPATVSTWRWRSEQGRLPDPMPEPRWTVSDQPAWDWPDIEKWYAKRKPKRKR